MNKKIAELKNKISGGFSIANDMMFTMGATVVMQIALQLILYPALNRFFGENITGTVLYFMGIVFIFPQAIGTALCNTRLISRKTMDTTNGDFSSILVVSSAVCGAVCFYIGYREEKDLIFSILFAIFTIVYAMRMYAMVDFRLNKNFKGYFIYHLIISIGYLLGFGIYFIVHYWLVIFFFGEILGVVYSLIRSSVFKYENPKGSFKKNIKDYILLVFSALLRDGVNQYDKVVIFSIISSRLVAQYNAVSLIGKSLQMLIGPINTLIVTYLSVKGAGFTKKQFNKFTLMSLGIGCVFILFSQIATPIYIKLFYSGFYHEIIRYSFIINCGLIIGFAASLFMATIMSQGKTAVYMAIQFAWGIIYIVFAYIFIKLYSIIGFAIVSAVVNTLKLIVSIIVARKTCLIDDISAVSEH